MKTAWIIRAYPHGINRLQYFLENNVVGIGWPGIGTLEDIVSREDVKSKLKSAGYTAGKTALSIGQAAGTIYRFACEMKAGDYVLVPNGSHIFVGKVLEDKPVYLEAFDKDDEGFCHQRKVEWLFNKRTINKQFMTSRVYDSFKGQSTLFTTWYDDIHDLITKKQHLFIGDDFQKQHLKLKEEYLKKLNEGKISGLNSNEIENVCKKILNVFFPGIERQSTTNTIGNGDTDLKAELIGGVVIRVQVKNFYKKFGEIEPWVVTQLADSMDENDNGIVMTTTTISSEATKLAEDYTKAGKKITFIDGKKFVDLIFENIDVFSDEELINLGLYKELIIL
ncbi:MAG: restriction endonuclease [Cetobacterium sp.]